MAGLFEAGHGLGAAVYPVSSTGQALDSAYCKGHALVERVEEGGGAARRGALVHAHNVTARGHVDGGEVLKDHAGQRTHVEGVDLYDIAGLNETFAKIVRISEKWV